MEWEENINSHKSANLLMFFSKSFPLYSMQLCTDIMSLLEYLSKASKVGQAVFSAVVYDFGLKWHSQSKEFSAENTPSITLHQYGVITPPPHCIAKIATASESIRLTLCKIKLCHRTAQCVWSLPWFITWGGHMLPLSAATWTQTGWLSSTLAGLYTQKCKQTHM